LRRCPQGVFIQEPDHPGNDGDIGQIEDIPDEIDRFRRDVEQDEIGDRPIKNAVDRVPDRPADDQPKRKGGELEFRAGKPDPQDNNRSGLEGQENSACSRSVRNREMA